MPQLSKLPDLYSVEHSRGEICLFFVSGTLPLSVYKITASHTVAHYKKGSCTITAAGGAECLA